VRKLFFFNIIATIFLLAINYETVIGNLAMQNSQIASGTIRIGLESRYLNENQVSVGGPVIINGTRFDGTVTIRVGGASSTHVELIYNNSIFSESHTPFVATAADVNGIYIRGRTYRGHIELGRQIPGNGITPVNVVSLEEYLKSVVPSEMPASWHMEALQAQAVAARTYSMYRRGSHNHLGYELCDTVFSQVYSGIEWEHYRTTQAVLNTTGRIITYDGLPILAVYSSSNGGFSESSEYVWLETVPYLRAVSDVYETGGLVWDRTVTREEIQNALPASANIGQVTSITLDGRTPGGRVHTLTIHGTNGNHSMEREAIRSFFSSIDGSLPSRMFQIGSPMPNISENMFGNELPTSPLTNYFAINDLGDLFRLPQTFYTLGQTGLYTLDVSQNQNSPVGSQNPPIVTERQTHNFSNGSVTLHGRGFGHGVGMSQFGAYSMARAGYTYVQILQHYFTETQIVTIN